MTARAAGDGDAAGDPAAGALPHPTAPAALDVVVVNWNAGAFLRDCVAALAQADAHRGRFHLVLVDNASGDASLRQLGATPVRTTIGRNAANRGFAAACNQGAREGSAPYLLFLNPDTRVAPTALDEALAFMDDARNATVGILGVQMVNDAGDIARSCSRTPTPGPTLARLLFLDWLFPRLVPPHFLTEWDHRDSRDVEQVIGAFFLVRRPLFERLGGFDERFFVFYEEVDFALRAQRAGARVHYLAGPRVHHAGGGTTRTAPAFTLFLTAQSRALFAFKHFPRPVALLHAIGTLTVEPLLRTAWLALRGRAAEAGQSLAAARRLWSGAPHLLRGREIPGTRGPRPGSEIRAP
jgi:GT2 family glycosyltransferase